MRTKRQIAPAAAADKSPIYFSREALPGNVPFEKEPQFSGSFELEGSTPFP